MPGEMQGITVSRLLTSLYTLTKGSMSKLFINTNQETIRKRSCQDSLKFISKHYQFLDERIHTIFNEKTENPGHTLMYNSFIDVRIKLYYTLTNNNEIYSALNTNQDISDNDIQVLKSWLKDIDQFLDEKLFESNRSPGVDLHAPHKLHNQYLKNQSKQVKELLSGDIFTGSSNQSSLDTKCTSSVLSLV